MLFPPSQTVFCIAKRKTKLRLASRGLKIARLYFAIVVGRRRRRRAVVFLLKTGPVYDDYHSALDQHRCIDMLRLDWRWLRRSWMAPVHFEEVTLTVEQSPCDARRCLCAAWWHYL